MTEEGAKRKLTLDRPVSYQIKVPGHLDESWSDWSGGMTITVTGEDDGRQCAGGDLTGARQASARAGSWAGQGAPWPSVAICQDWQLAGVGYGRSGGLT
jgi:hypothetical protein